MEKIGAKIKNSQHTKCVDRKGKTKIPNSAKNTPNKWCFQHDLPRSPKKNGDFNPENGTTLAGVDQLRLDGSDRIVFDQIGRQKKLKDI